MSLTLLGCAPTTEVRYVYNELEPFKFNVDPQTLPAPKPLAQVPVPANAKEVPASLVLQIAVANNMACLKTESDYEFLFKEYMALRVAVVNYVDRYNKLAKQSSADAESKK